MKDKSPAMLIPFENEQLEYKLTVDKDDLCREIVALANTNGGRIIIGITDNRTVVGAGKLTADNVSNMVRNGCVPPLAPKINREDIDGKEVTTVIVDPDGDVPYRTNRGVYHIRVGATVRIASLSELIDLIVKGRYRDTILHRTKIPQLLDQIRASMLANAGFDQALTDIAALSDLARKADESTKIEVVNAVGELLRIHCTNDTVIQRMLILLAILTSNDLAQSLYITPPSRTLFEQVIAIMKSVLFIVTVNPKVTDRTEHILHALYLVGLGCIWSKYDDQFEKVMEIVNSNCNRDRKLTKLCRGTAARLEKCAAEEPTYPPRRMGMVMEFFVDRRSPVRFSPFRSLF